MSTAKGLYRLLTVNKVPERARFIIGQVVEKLEDRYEIQHVDNCDSIDQVSAKVTELKPDMLFCASMWTPEESEQIQSIARSIKPDIITHAIPQGLQAEQGPDGVVKYLTETIPKLLRGTP